VPRTTTRIDGGARERAIAWRHAEHARICDVVEPTEHGTLVRCTRMPTFWNYNSLRVEGPDAGASADALVHAADVLQGDLAHRQVEVEDEGAGARLRPGFEALGWAAERLAWLLLDGPAPVGPDLEEVPFPATVDLRLEWATTAPWATDPEAARRFAGHEDTVAELRGSRALIARDDAGATIGFVSFGRRDDTAEVEQVYVTDSQRGRGIGGALVSAAVRRARAAATLIVADDEADAKRLYERLGFRTVWLQHVFTRRPG
jgi:ribosomal protein S18 acetylase RimI-like enzyme